jgi:ribosomal protein L11 methyltransferase
MSNYIELAVIVEPKEQGSDILIAQLSELDFESFVESDNGFLAYIQEEQFNEESLKGLFAEFEESNDFTGVPAEKRLFKSAA